MHLRHQQGKTWWRRSGRWISQVRIACDGGCNLRVYGFSKVRIRCAARYPRWIAASIVAGNSPGRGCSLASISQAGVDTSGVGRTRTVAWRSRISRVWTGCRPGRPSMRPSSWHKERIHASGCVGASALSTATIYVRYGPGGRSSRHCWVGSKNHWPIRQIMYSCSYYLISNNNTIKYFNALASDFANSNLFPLYRHRFTIY